MIHDKRGSSEHIEKAVLLVVVLVLIAFLSPVALTALFNSTAFTCANGYNSTGNYCNNNQTTGVGGWVPNVMGTIGVVAIVLVLVYAVLLRTRA